MKITQDGQAAKVISGFPGVGKSFLTKGNTSNLKVLDSDSTEYSKLADGKTPNPAWPKNYIDHIKEQSTKVDIIFVSTHKDTRSLLVENKIPFTLVYPDKSLKSEYMARYKTRGTPEFLQTILDKNWDTFVTDCEKQGDCEHVKLTAGQYMADVTGHLLDIHGHKGKSEGSQYVHDVTSHLRDLLTK